MSSALDVAVLVGSLRKGSINRKVARTLLRLSPPELSPEIVEIGGLRLYNPDLEGDPEWESFRARILRTDAVLFVSPEYNRSMPGALKNAIDIGSRPYGKNVWDGKPAGVMTVSPGALGGFGANHHLRQTLVTLNMPAMQQPEAYVSLPEVFLSADGNIANPGMQEFFIKFMTAFAGLIERFRTAGARKLA